MTEALADRRADAEFYLCGSAVGETGEQYAHVYGFREAAPMASRALHTATLPL